MSRRLEVELTSKRDDGNWTWRAAGARQPKGDLAGSLVPEGTNIGDVVKVEADFDIDGITIIAVLPPQKARREPERLEIIGSSRHEGGVTTSLLSKSERGPRRDDRRGDGERRRPSGDRPSRPGRSDRPRSDAGSDDKRGARDGKGGRAARPARDGERRPDVKPPKAKRLKAGRKHRNLVLKALPAEQRVLADQVLRGGVPGVRQTVERLNEVAAAESRPPINPAPLVTLAERLLPALRGAEWYDRAEAAINQLDTVDLGDLRSVVNAADTWARDEETRALATQLREGLPKRVDKEHHDWLDEITATLDDGRLVRALRLSSRPPKAGAPLPSELATRLATTASDGLTAETGAERYAAVLDALALSPVHAHVTPTGAPSPPGDALLATVRRTAKQLPQVASLFGVEPPSTSRRGGRPPRAGRGATPPPPPPVPQGPIPDAPVADAPVPEEPVSDHPV
jgi:hypothetical protein